MPDESGVAILDTLDTYIVMLEDWAWYRYLNKDRAEKAVETYNKRHIICAMSSVDPKHPVLI